MQLYIIITCYENNNSVKESNFYRMLTPILKYIHLFYIFFYVGEHIDFVHARNKDFFPIVKDVALTNIKKEVYAIERAS